MPVDNGSGGEPRTGSIVGMTFEDLPADWPDRPLDDPLLVTDVLDLCVSMADRAAGAIVFLLCDPEGRLAQPVAIGELPPRFTVAECEHAIEVMVQAMDGHGSLHVAIARRDGLTITEDDRVWAAAASRVTGDRVQLLGVHVVTMTGSRTVPVRGQLAA
jgi:hypothetical protein